MQVPYRLVVEPQEAALYAAEVDPAKLLILPFSNLGQGSIPARNWVWEHSISEGHERHWILDDNIRWFFRFHQNLRVKVLNGVPFQVVEDFADRYLNVAMAGIQYAMFVPRRKPIAPITLNTRIYSCILLANNLKCRWRGRYNEDTDLSIRILKDGYCTALFNTFICGKIGTMRLKGGNTEQLYQGDGRLKMAKSLQKQHPEITTIKWKWGRWQHEVDYSGFKRNKLIRKPGVEIPRGADEYGLVLTRDK